MLPGRHLLYHRGIDDHSGTYITDYTFAGACCVLCLHLLVRMKRETKRVSDELNEYTAGCRIANCMPWNWPKSHPTPVTMTTYGVLFLGISNMMMALLGGLAHQYLQTVEADSNHPSNFHGWLILWRFAASFSAVLFLGLVIMAEQLVVQEHIFSIHRRIRQVYYAFFFLVSVVFYLYNFYPVMVEVEDPFSIGKSFMVCFAVMFFYGICALALLFKYYCCFYRNKTSYCESTVEYSASNSFENSPAEKITYRKDLYDCCKTVAGGCRENAHIVASRNVELILTAVSPWIYVVAGVINHLLKEKCSDSDDAAAELGCPLPNSFNHNAIMHLIQIFSLLGFFVAEHISITRRRILCLRISDKALKRTRTSSTIYNDCIIEIEVDEKSPLRQQYLNNNNKLVHNRDDVVYGVTSQEVEETLKEIVDTPTEDNETTKLPKFPTSFDQNNDRASDNRISVYDNLT